MGIGRNTREAGVKQPNPCELYPLSVTDISRELIWSPQVDMEAPNQLRDWRQFTGAQLSMQDVGVTPPRSALWWTVTATPREIAREVTRTPDGPVTVPVLNSTTVGEGIRATPIQLVVRFRSDEIYVDIGRGCVFSVLTEEISANLWAPVGETGAVRQFQTRCSSNPTTLDLESLPINTVVPVFDTSIAINFTASSAPGRTRAPITCTRTYDPTDTDVPQPEGTAAPQPGDFEIPPRAKRVQFTERYGDEPVVTDVGVEFLSDVVNRYSRGAVQQWDVGARQRTSPWTDVPGNARLINISDLAGRAVTAVWELDL